MLKMTELKDCFELFLKDQKIKHDELLKKTEAFAVAIKYSDKVLNEFYPYENEIFGGKKGSELKEPELINKDIIRNFYNPQDILVMSEHVLSGDRVTSRTFYLYNNEFSERISFQKIGGFRLRSIARLFQDNQNLILLNKGIHGESIWFFNYKNDVLESIEVKEKDVINNVDQKRRIEFINDDNNEPIEIINRYENGSSQVMYAKKS